MTSNQSTEGYGSARSDEAEFDAGLDIDGSADVASGNDIQGNIEIGNGNGNGDANGNANTTRPARRNPFNEAASLMNHGGLGHMPTPPQSASRISPGPAPAPTSTSEITNAINTYERSFFPNHPKSLSGIALRSFLLGLTLALSLTTTLYLLLSVSTPLWRVPFFLASLSTFHFLEFYTTALTNTPSASVSSFLLASNGSAYTIAHTAALIECLLSHLLYPSSILPSYLHYIALFLGLAAILLGQSIRATAMLQAGSNFSHIVAHTKRSTHRLVTEGLYSVLRHPSYFGYFWWAVGTQLVCGNVVCLVAYALVLWRFFDRRIEGEEELLVAFFGEEYVQYRKRTWVGIPGIK